MMDWGKDKMMVGFIEAAGNLVELLLGNEKTKITNVIVAYRNQRLRAFLFPRWIRLPINYVKHFQDKDKTIKPGSSEMAGLIVRWIKRSLNFPRHQMCGKPLIT